VDRYGRRSEFSSTGEEGEQYVSFGFYGENGVSIDPRDGQIVAWSGTSKASPNGGGAFHARSLHGDAVLEFARTYTTGDQDADGIPNGIHPDHLELIRSGGFHAEVGVGNCEGLRQQTMKTSGRALAIYDAVSTRGVRPIFHDMTPLSPLP
jgi:hypothetical protein